MAELKYAPVRHSHREFLARAANREGFAEAYDALALKSAGKHAPSLATLKRYAQAVGCELQVKLVPQKTADV